MSNKSEAMAWARDYFYYNRGWRPDLAEKQLKLVEALLQAREALAGDLDQPETPESYDAMLSRTTAALAAIDALRKEQK